jgi:hypothetical protein
MVVLLVHALSLIDQPLMPWRLADLAPYAIAAHPWHARWPLAAFLYYCVCSAIPNIKIKKSWLNKNIFLLHKENIFLVKQENLASKKNFSASRGKNSNITQRSAIDLGEKSSRHIYVK